jgi:kynurenine 3-monooxygenase
MDKRAIHLVDKLNFQNYGQEGESIYSISRGALNKRMIDLAEQAGAEFFFEQKIWDVTCLKLLYTGETERELGKKRNMRSFWCDGAFGAPPCNAKVCLTIRRSFKYWLQGTKYSRKSDGSHKLDKNSFHIWPRGEYMLIALPNLDVVLLVLYLCHLKVRILLLR